MTASEVNFDSLVGPTHNYAGLAHGNLASQQNKDLISNPREAALQGLAKMKRVMDLGIPQGILPPHPRPDIAALRRLGFSGSDETILRTALREDTKLLSACNSASAMWAANAATISPSADTADNRVHITPANLISHLHRSLETPVTARLLREIFHDSHHFTHHPPLPASLDTSDEGAANHTRLCPAYDQPGIELFTYGREKTDTAASRFLPRQTLEASKAIARLHTLQPHRTAFFQQHPEAIAAGVFHNDVIAVGNRNVLLCHDRAFADPAVPARIAEKYADLSGMPLHVCIVPEQILPLPAAVKSYLFNSQLLSLPDGSMMLLAPADCQEIPEALTAVDFILQSGTPISRIDYVDVRQSMRNGGGPACLRLRVVLTAAELAATHHGAILTPALYASLQHWIKQHYRDRLAPADLADPELMNESRRALNDLSEILNLKTLVHGQS